MIHSGYPNNSLIIIGGGVFGAAIGISNTKKPSL